MFTGGRRAPNRPCSASRNRVRSDARLVWASERLGVAGSWTPLAPPLEATLFESPSGSVEWTCHQPRALARVNLSGAPFEGFGYAEHLVLTVAPWSLPIDELRWGRFLGRDHALVWIDWRGPHRKQLVALDGARSDGARIDDGSVVSADGQVGLSIEDNVVLRHGRIGKTALAKLATLEGRGLQRLPLRILEVDEVKWRGRGTLRTQGRSDSGWVIHEVVRWPAQTEEPT